MFSPTVTWRDTIVEETPTLRRTQSLIVAETPSTGTADATVEIDGSLTTAVAAAASTASHRPTSRGDLGDPSRLFLSPDERDFNGGFAASAVPAAVANDVRPIKLFGTVRPPTKKRKEPFGVRSSNTIHNKSTNLRGGKVEDDIDDDVIMLERRKSVDIAKAYLRRRSSTL